MNSERSKLQFDYQLTLDQFKLLAEIRFKLLAFVPTLAGAAIALLTGSIVTVAPATAFAVGILGFLVTIGITFYNIRNTQFYDAAVNRAKSIEADLHLPAFTQGQQVGGYFNESPDSSLKLFRLFPIKHRPGLALVYGSALGGWAYIIAYVALTLVNRTEIWIALVIAFVVGVLFTWEYVRLIHRNKSETKSRT